LGWSTLDDKTKAGWKKTLDEHEKTHPQQVIKDIEGNILEDDYTPRIKPLDISLEA